jgi:hypothetical protein
MTHWYELGWHSATTSSTAENTFRSGRVYVIRCRKCKGEDRFPPHSASDEQLRKKKISEGWEIGKNPKQHLCPTCVRHKSPSISPPLPPVIALPGPEPRQPDSIPFLTEAWDAANSEDQQALISEICTRNTQLFLEIIDRLAAATSAAEMRRVMFNIWLRYAAPTLLEFWRHQADALQRTELIDWLKQQEILKSEDTLHNHWLHARPSEREAFDNYMRPRLERPLLERWHAATDDQRHKFLDYLGQAHLLQKPEPKPVDLFDAYDAAPADQRDSMVRQIDDHRRERGWYIGKTPPCGHCGEHGSDGGITGLCKQCIALGINLVAVAKPESEADATLCCSFCGKKAQQVRKLVAGDKANICNECLILANGAVAKSELKNPEAAFESQPKPPGKSSYRPPGAISKTEFAQLIRRNRSTVSGYMHKGLPQRADGFLDRETALAWYEQEQQRARPIDGTTRFGHQQTAEALIFEMDDDAAFAELATKLFGPSEK